MLIEKQRFLQSSIVRIESGENRGTGFWIKGKENNFYIITCTHVLEEDEPIKVFLFDGKSRFNVQVFASLVALPLAITEGDVTLLQIESKDIPSYTMALELLDIPFNNPFPFRAWGFTDAFSDNGRFANGTIEALTTLNDVPLWQLKTDLDIREGFSGGPIVHADFGYVMGVISDAERSSSKQLDLNSYAVTSSFISSKFNNFLSVQTLHPYQAWLSSFYHEIVLNDEKGLRLSDIYIQPNYLIYKSAKFINEGLRLGSFGERINDFYWIDDIDIIHNVLNRQASFSKYIDYQITLLLGYPGQGKSSLTKRLLHDEISKFPNRPIYLVRLGYIANSKELLDNPFLLLEKEIVRQGKPYSESSNELNNSILVLDGLDEISIKNDMSSEDIDEIIKGIYRNAAQYPGMKVIITSRYGYVNLQEVSSLNILIVQLSEFTPDQQIEWVNRYNRFHPETHLDVKRLQNFQHADELDSFRELLTQPIMLHMIATLDRGFFDASNRSAVYTELFDQLVKRPWSKDGNIAGLSGIVSEPNLLREALQDIAHVMFYSEKGHINKSILDKLPKVQQLHLKLNNRIDVWRSVMIAFYMKESSENINNKFGTTFDYNYDYVIEFLHKSLPEYLCAEKIWRSFIELFSEENSEPLDKLFIIFNRKVINKEIVDYLVEIISNDTKTNKEVLVTRIIELLPNFLNYDFFSTKAPDKPLSVIRSMFYGFWTIFSHLHSFDKLNILLQNHVVQFIRLLNADHAHYLNLKNIQLPNINLYEMNLSGSNFNKVNLSGSNLSGSNLVQANFTATNMNNVILTGAKLLGIQLSKANLKGAYLNGVDLSNIDLSGADLTGTDLSTVNFYKSNLSTTKLLRVNLSGANLARANMYMANLSGADLYLTNMSFTNLSGVDMSYSRLIRAKLSRAKLYFSDLTGADLSKATLNRTNMRYSNLSGANLIGADLTGADLTSANLSDCKNLTLLQLESVRTLYKCIGIPAEIEEQLLHTHPQLFAD